MLTAHICVRFTGAGSIHPTLHPSTHALLTYANQGHRVMGRLESALKQTFVFLDCGRKVEYLEKPT